MQLTRPPLHLPRLKTGRRYAGHVRTTTVKPTVAPARERNKRANVSQDAATYSCCCGFVFTAAVTTSVGCPHCGIAQAW
jgi:hypothetical protein